MRMKIMRAVRGAARWAERLLDVRMPGNALRGLR